MTPPQTIWGYLEVDRDMFDDPDNQIEAIEYAQLVLG